MERKLLILTDYKDFFATKLEGEAENTTRTTMDVQRLKKLFEEKGFEVSICSMSEADLSADYTGTICVYASIEDNGQFYKHYIEDILFCLKEKGAVLIPDFKWQKAHSDKVVQELIRASFRDGDLRTPRSLTLGHADELRRIQTRAEKELQYPMVVKVSSGSGSRGVELANNAAELEQKVRYLTEHHYRDFADTLYLETGLLVKRLLRRITGRRVEQETILSHMYTNKVILQQFIPGLSGDYKVLFFAGRYFVLNRKNRDNDFRASGSGKFSYPEETEEFYRVLELARKAAAEIGMPMQSLDIGCNESGCFLLEFQCVYFGPYTLQFAPCCYEYAEENGCWKRIDGSFDLEEEYVRAVTAYAERL